MSVVCHPEKWVGLGFVATIENAPAHILKHIEGITAVAAQIAWGQVEQKPDIIGDYLASLQREGLDAVGWAWCDAENIDAARDEARVHASLVAKHSLTLFIANQEEEYDAHGDSGSPKYRMGDAYCETFRSILPDVELGVTTLNRCGSSQQGMREAGVTIMPQAFFGEAPGATVDTAVAHSVAWGWPISRIRPLCQVYETRGQVPDPNVYLQESSDWDVGLVPYILEQALSGAGLASLTALVPAITRLPAAYIPPTNGGTVPPGNEIPPIKPNEIIGSEHGISAFVDWLQKQPGMPTRSASYNPAKPGTWPWPERLERALKILAADHDASA